MKKLDFYNFHSHTRRCGHADGEDEDYILEAINSHFKHYGMSDHMMFPFLDQPRLRGHYETDFPSYLASFKALKEKYQNQIDLHIGMEAEYHPKFVSFYEDLLENHLEYLIIGQHQNFDDDYTITPYNRFPDGAERYTKHLIEGIKSGLFLYICHPDLIVYFYQDRDEHLKEMLTEIVKAAKEYDVPLEINTSRVAGNYLRGDKDPKEHADFPLDMLWDIVSEYKANAVIGLDCHVPIFANHRAFEWGVKYAQDRDINVLSAEELFVRMKKIKTNILKKKYPFFGVEYATETHPIDHSLGLNHLLDLYKALLNSWSIETCAPRLRDKWNLNNRSEGQCSITSFLVQDLFGGEVYGVPLKDGNFHCYNYINGHVFDLTSEQFDEPLSYELKNPQDRNVHFQKEEKKERYLLLKNRLSEYLNK